MKYTDLWPLIQRDVLGVLLADPFIGSRPGVAVEPGDTDSNVDTKLAKVIGKGTDGKLGVGFLVLPIERAEDENENIPGGPLKLTICIQFCENVLINNSNTGTGIPIRIYAAHAEKLLKLYTPVGLTQSFVPANPVIYEFTDDKNKSLRVGLVEFTATEADFTPVTKLPRPQILPNDSQGNGGAVPQTVTISCAGAATIYYTLDGSHPYDRNPQAKLYDQPFVLAECALVRARGFAADPQCFGSDTAAVLFE